MCYRDPEDPNDRAEHYNRLMDLAASNGPGDCDWCGEPLPCDRVCDCAAGAREGTGDEKGEGGEEEEGMAHEVIVRIVVPDDDQIMEVWV